jgi:hypothetical protein
MYRFVFRKVEVGIGPFLPGLGWGGDSNHCCGKVIGMLERVRELGNKIDGERRAKFWRERELISRRGVALSVGLLKSWWVKKERKDC